MMTEAELVEHVAEAIWREDRAIIGKTGGQWKCVTTGEKAYYRKFARAAIAAYEEAHKTEPYFVPQRMKLGPQE